MDTASMNIKSSDPSIHKFPPEILGIIFGHYVDLQSFLIHTARAPLLLTHVCRKWRYVAFATPDLWTTVWVGDGTQRLITPSWIQRSGGLPLSLALNFADLRNFKVGDQDALMCCLRNNNHRIRVLRLFLFLTPSSFNQFLPLNAQSHMMSLETLVIRGSSQSIIQLSAIFAPNLRSLAMTEHVEHVQRLLPNSLSSLTSLRLASLQKSVSAVCELLAACPALTDCVIKFTCMLLPLPLVRVCLAQLRSLEVRYTRNEEPLTGFLQLLYLPRLQSLRIQFDHYEQSTQEEQDILSKFACLDLTGIMSSASWDGESFIKLTLLSLSDINITETQWKPFLKVATSLERLEFSDCLGPNSVLEALAEDDGLCPSLKSIMFDWCFTAESLFVPTPCSNCGGTHVYEDDSEDEVDDLDEREAWDEEVNYHSGPECDLGWKDEREINLLAKGCCGVKLEEQMEHMKMMRDASLQYSIEPLLNKVGNLRGLLVQANWEQCRYSLTLEK